MIRLYFPPFLVGRDDRLVALAKVGGQQEQFTNRIVFVYEDIAANGDGLVDRTQKDTTDGAGFKPQGVDCHKDTTLAVLFTGERPACLI